MHTTSSPTYAGTRRRVIAPAAAHRRRRHRPWRGLLALAAWLAALGAVFAGLTIAGTGVLAAPDLTAPGTWAAWVEGRTAPEAAFAVLRLGVQVVALYLVAATLVALAAAVWRGGRLVTVAEVVTLPVVRRMVQGMVGLTVAGASVAAVGAGFAPSARSGTAADVALASAVDDVADGAAPAAVAGHGPAVSGTGPASPPPVLRLVDGGPTGSADDTDGRRTAPVTDAGPDAPGVVEGPAAAAPRPDGGAVEHVVGPGDHLWSVSAGALGTALGRPATDAEVSGYLEALVTANADRLADPSNPDLLYPGQVLVLPPVPGG